jgi:hypothetical protein
VPRALNWNPGCRLATRAQSGSPEGLFDPLGTLMHCSNAGQGPAVSRLAALCLRWAG